jgi:hypothetical protein
MQPEPSPDDIQTLLTYAKRKYAEEQWPDSLALLPVREALERVFPRKEPKPLPPHKPHIPSLAEQRRKARKR